MSQSIATIDSPEFINLEPLEINPLMSSCEIKVLYVGENRNRSFITKEVAMEMSKTLRGAPIVGYYKEKKEDFADHGERVTFDDEGVKIECLTKPYGFVSPDAKVWFQKFKDTDEFGNVTEREYLMTTGYLWTGQFDECADVPLRGRPQSMELDKNSLDGHWSTNAKTGMDFFIINDATFSKLCILGEDVEPCFEGANITSPELSNTFSLDKEEIKTLYDLMLKFVKLASEGGQQMNEFENQTPEVVEAEAPVVEEAAVEFEAETEVQEPVVETEFAEAEEAPAEETPVASDFKKEEEEDKEEESDDSEKEEEDEDKKSNFVKEDDKEEEKEESSDDSEEEKEEDEDKKKYSLLVEEHEELKTEFAKMQAEVEELRNFKKNVEDAQKEELINKFYMLSDEEKKPFVENIDKYSYKELDSELSMIFAHRQMEAEINEVVEEVAPATYDINSSQVTVLPEWLQAVKENREI